MMKGAAHYSTAGVRGWLGYFFTPAWEQSAWRYWKPPCLTRAGWAETIQFWSGGHKDTQEYWRTHVQEVGKEDFG